MSASVPSRIGSAPVLVCLSLCAACSSPDSTSRETTANTGVSTGQETVDAAALDATRDACVRRVFCILIDHWDPQLCRCVPNFDAGPGAASDAGEAETGTGECDAITH